MRFVILGAGGFLGKNLFEHLSAGGFNVIGLQRPTLDYTSPLSFANFALQDGDVLLDCVSRIDGDGEQIRKVNIEGLKNFLDHLHSQNKDFLYIYFSTYSTLLEGYVNTNPYVNSKFQAENFIREHVKRFKIVRLIFPFGRGENRNRLVSRLINKFRSGDAVSVERLTLNLTPITQILTNFERILKHPSAEINFSNDILYFLPAVAGFIASALGVKNGYAVTEKTSVLNVESTIKIEATEDEVWKEIASMIYE